MQIKMNYSIQIDINIKGNDEIATKKKIQGTTKRK
jgi:hypothetical protein